MYAVVAIAADPYVALRYETYEVFGRARIVAQLPIVETLHAVYECPSAGVRRIEMSEVSQLPLKLLIGKVIVGIRAPVLVEPGLKCLLLASGQLPGCFVHGDRPDVVCGGVYRCCRAGSV